MRLCMCISDELRSDPNNDRVPLSATARQDNSCLQQRNLDNQRRRELMTNDVCKIRLEVR